MFDRQAQLLGTEIKKARSVSQTLTRFWTYFQKYQKGIFLVALLVVLSVGIQVLVPELIGQAVDCYLDPVADGEAATCWYDPLGATANTASTIASLGWLVLLIGGLYVVSSVISGLSFYAMSWAGLHVLRDMQHDIFQQVHRLSLRYFSKNEAGDIMSRLTNDIDTIQQIIGFGLVSVFQGGLTIFLIVATMLYKSVFYAFLSLLTLPLMFLVTQFFSNQARKAFRAARQEIGSVNADLQESISAVREVQAFSREAENIEQFRVSNAANRDANIRAQAFTSALAPSLEALSFVSLAIVAGVGGYLILTDTTVFGSTVSLGLIVTFIAYVQQLSRPCATDFDIVGKCTKCDCGG